MSKIEIRIEHTGLIFIEADADKFGEIFAYSSDEEQVDILRAMVKHMRPHKAQWDYISIELEKPENSELLNELRSVLFPVGE